MMAQVLVWLPSKGAGGINVGHAALLTDKARRPAYVSWWPNGAAGLKESTTTGHYANNFAADVEAEGGQPTIIDLPSLNDQAIADWWERVRDNGFATPYSLEVLPKSDNYDLYSNNCSTIVFRAMLIGGAAEIVSYPKFDTVTPVCIMTWAKLIVAKTAVTGWLKTAFDITMRR